MAGFHRNGWSSRPRLYEVRFKCGCVRMVNVGGHGPAVQSHLAHLQVVVCVKCFDEKLIWNGGEGYGSDQS